MNFHWIIVGFAICQGFAILFWGVKGTIILLGVAYIFFLIRWPHIALIISIVVIFDGFGFINPETFFRIPGVFKIKDLIFSSLFIPIIINKKWQNRFYYIFLKYHSMLTPIVIILFLTTLQMIRTSLQYNLPLNTSIMTGRHYWYYAFLPLAAIYLDSSKKRKLVSSLFLAVISILASVVIVQTLLTAFDRGRLVSINIQFNPVTWGNLHFFRIYPPGEATLVLVFSLSFWAFFMSPQGSQRIVYIAPMLLCGFAVLLLNSRMRWFHAVILVLVPKLLLTKYIPIKARRSLYIAVFASLIVISVLCFSSSTRDLLAGITQRASSAATDFIENKGTWQYRVEDSAFRFRLIRKHPLFGVGMVHVYHAREFGGYGIPDEMGAPYQGISTTDSGIVTLLVTFGLVGVIWAIWYFISVLKFCLKNVKSIRNRYITAVSIAVVGYMIGGILVFITLGLFTMPDDIIGSSFILGLLASNTGLKTRAEYSQR